MNRPGDDPSVEQLIRLAGERDMPSDAGTLRARAAAEQAWRDMLAQPVRIAPRRGWLAALGIALAAGLAVIAWLVSRDTYEVAAPITLASVVAVEGGATQRTAGEGSGSPATVNSMLTSGTLLETSQGRLAISFGNALSLRLDRATRLRLDGRDRVTLLEGSLYVDSGGFNTGPALRILTPAGAVRHVGTQFQVSVANDLTRVRVREGRVLVDPAGGGTAQDLATGDELESRGAQSRLIHGLPSFGPAWDWVVSVAPVLTIENRPLAEFLAWLAREHGWQLRYSMDGVQDEAGRIRLHGSFEGLDVTAMLERVTLVTGVPVVMQDGILWVGARR